MTTNLFGDVPVLDTGARNDFDFYPTPGFMTRSLLHFHPAICESSVLEPCSGQDHIALVLRASGCLVYTNDLDPRQPSETHHDATHASYWTEYAPRVDWVITNPTFVHAFPILQFARRHARIGVAFLLRKTFLEPTDDRGPWLGVFPPTRIIGQPRYSFRGTGSDSVSADWVLWERDRDLSLPPIVVDHAAERRTR